MRHSVATSIFGKEGAPLFLKGVKLFNEGKHWEAHELFEDVWRLQEGDAKKLAQGFVQMAAAFSYIRKKRFESIIYLFDKSSEKLIATMHLLPESNIPHLVDVMNRAKGEVQRLGEAKLDEFPPSLYPIIVIGSDTPQKKKKTAKRK